MRIILTILFLVTFSGTKGQSQEDDEVTFQYAIDWLNSKLEYVYYDNIREKWWLNTFYVNENKEVTIKQISSKTRVTANIKAKNYTIRKFRIQDINPYSLSIKEVKASSGRIVEGKLLEIHTVEGKHKIHKTINNRKATSTSFLHLSFPKALTDSLTNYPELVMEKFRDAVIATTKVYRIDEEGNKMIVLETLKGTYTSEHGDSWVADERFPGILKIQADDKDKFLGFDAERNLYFMTVVSAKGVNTHYFKIDTGADLVLKDIEDDNYTLRFHTFNSFQLNGVWYYRG